MILSLHHPPHVNIWLAPTQLSYIMDLCDYRPIFQCFLQSSCRGVNTQSLQRQQQCKDGIHLLVNIKCLAMSCHFKGIFEILGFSVMPFFAPSITFEKLAFLHAQTSRMNIQYSFSRCRRAYLEMIYLLLSGKAL